MAIIAPSILSADFANLQKDVEMLNQSRADWIHLDIMDGVFVPNISFGLPVVRHIKKYSRKPLDIHLMIENPERYIDAFCKAGADILTVHYEACRHLHSTIQKIKEKRMKAGISLNPHTPINCLHDIICEADLILIMSVNPGFGGQNFIENSYRKIQKLKTLADKKNPEIIIEVDGGINLLNAKKVLNSGSNALVAGSSIFKSKKPKETIATLKSL